jgi:predicted DNA-binding transcriptional regulator AlpA
MIEHHQFPPGIMLSPNVRAWTVDEVQQWLANRPSQRKVPPPLKPGSKRGPYKRKESTT